VSERTDNAPSETADDAVSTHSEGEGAPAGIDADSVTAWLAERVDALAEPLRFDLILGGQSNLTFRVTDADGRRWVLRRPPLKQVLATAHDMAREHRIMAALAPTDVPVPPLVGLCEDPAVNGAPFYVMEFVDGYILRDVALAEKLGAPVLAAAGESLIQTLVAIHEVDVDAVGLGDLGRREDYLARQLKRWYRQFENSKLREIPVVDEVHAELVRTMPAQHGATIVHGDYRLDNCLLDPTGSIAAVLDWELCTLGDPLADVGIMITYTRDAAEVARRGMPAATALPGFPSRPELIERYAEVSGRDVSKIGYYIAFGHWKLACIMEGVYARYVGGAMGNRDRSSWEFLGDQVIATAQQAAAALEKA
jgi:aminoglycoside phosphotransferase (APT) family kinase protein